MSDSMGELPALGVSINAQFAAGRQIVFQTHVAQDVSGEDLDRLLDKLNASVDRAEAFYSIEDFEKALKVNENQLYVLNQRINEMDAGLHEKASDGRRSARQPSPKEIGDRANAVASKQKFEELIAEDRKKLDAIKAKAGTRYGAPGSADH